MEFYYGLCIVNSWTYTCNSWLNAWKFKLVELLAGYKENSNVDKDLLAKVTGLSLLLLGFLLLAESTLIFKDVIKQDAAILLVLLSIILGTIVTALIFTQF